MALLCASSFTAWGQMGDYLGPGVLSRGAGDIGTRSGAPVDLRYYFDVSGFYDTGIQPFAVDSKGNLAQINGEYGEQVDFGAFGTHRWAHSQLGLNFAGGYYHYQNGSTSDGSQETLQLGYTHQQSRRIVYDMRIVAGTSSLGVGGPGFYGVPSTGATESLNNPSLILFDNRVYYLDPSMDMTFTQTSRTSYTFGGEGYFIRRAASGLASLNGYSLHGTIRHRLSKDQSIGFTYEHTHYDFPPVFGQSDINAGQVSWSSRLGKRWSVNVGGGAYVAEVQGVQQFTLNPVIAALLGTAVGEQAFYAVNVLPSATLSLSGTFRKSSVTVAANQSVAPGNGVYLTSQQRTASAGYSYSGIRKWNFGASVSYTSLSSIGQGLQPYANVSGGVGVTYTMTHALHLIVRADSRYQQIDVIGYNRTGYRASFGIGFSPGNVPLSLW